MDVIYLYFMFIYFNWYLFSKCKCDLSIHYNMLAICSNYYIICNNNNNNNIIIIINNNNINNNINNNDNN